MSAVPFTDLTRQHAPLESALHAAAREVLESGRYVGGPEVAAFECEMAGTR